MAGLFDNGNSKYLLGADGAAETPVINSNVIAGESNDWERDGYLLVAATSTETSVISASAMAGQTEARTQEARLVVYIIHCEGEPSQGQNFRCYPVQVEGP